MAVIEVNHVTKEYRLGQLHSIKKTLVNCLSTLRGQPTKQPQLFKALDDVNFHIEKGEVVGIIGQNGAGKSTLLKLLANISAPTCGDVKVRGKVAPLIEVGAGLIPDMTGRENIYLNGTILGMKRAELDKRFDEIVAFAELEEFIDTPVKRYSSGMKVRLGFSIATSIDAEILIVDEVLAVGDLAFQRKCFDRMEDMIKRRGKTVLLVSHNIRQVERMCSRVILLDQGKILADSDADTVCDLFYNRSNQKVISQGASEKPRSESFKSSDEIFFEKIMILNDDGDEVNEVLMGENITLRAKFDSTVNFRDPEIVFGFHTTDFFYITSMGTAYVEDKPQITTGENTIDCRIDKVNLVPGVYCIRFGVLDKNRREVFYGENILSFSVVSGKISAAKIPMLGVVFTEAAWEAR